MRTLGLTGGIGMGKSAAASLLVKRGVPVIDTDVVAREVVEPGEPGLEQLREAFGPGIVGPDGRLLRNELAKRVFADTAARKVLESILHPRIRTIWRDQREAWRREGRKAGVVVIPLLFETGAEAELDATLCVACSRATQSKRLADRGWSASDVEARLAAQWPIEEKMARATYVLWTEGELDVLGEQLSRVLAAEELKG